MTLLQRAVRRVMAEKQAAFWPGRHGAFNPFIAKRQSLLETWGQQIPTPQESHSVLERMLGGARGGSSLYPPENLPNPYSALLERIKNSPLERIKHSPWPRPQAPKVPQAPQAPKVPQAPQAPISKQG